MKFKIKQLDSPLHVRDDMQCKLCLQSGYTRSNNQHCSYCRTIKQAVSDLTKMGLLIWEPKVAEVKEEELCT